MNKKLLVAVIMGLVVGSLVFYANSSLVESQHVINNYNVLIEKPPVLESEAKAITLYEAWDITQAFAREWSEDAELISLTSADVDDPDAIESGQDSRRWLGQDGRRRTWQAVLTSPGLNKRLFLQITDGVVVDALEDGIHDPGIPTLAGKPAMDSPEAIGQAKTIKPNFSMSVGRGKGYHFILQTAISGKPVLTVVGSHPVGDVQSPAAIEFDQKTGQLVNTQYYTTIGGLSKWKDF